MGVRELAGIPGKVSILHVLSGPVHDQQSRSSRLPDHDAYPHQECLPLLGRSTRRAGQGFEVADWDRMPPVPGVPSERRQDGPAHDQLPSDAAAVNACAQDLSCSSS
eukprot:8971038-Pyramimonas_sp.AAC.1